MPGANQRALEKARSLAADVLILDLEDAVSPELKDEARDNIARAVAAGGYGAREVIIRCNGLDTEWGARDLAMAVAAAPDGVLLPKVTCAGDIEAIDQALTNAGAPPSLALWSMIEMPLAILNIRAIAAASQGTRLAGFVMGLNDLAKEMAAIPTPDRRAFQVALGLTLAAARAYGLAALDAVFNDIADEQGLAAECEQGRVLGFDGKSLIHPAQLATANRVYSPDPGDVAHARAVIEAFALPENQGKGVIKVDGRMTELLHLEQARRLVAISEAIAAQGE
jgi:citrate lyase subunit beta/citryl-CoA lyase